MKITKLLFLIFLNLFVCLKLLSSEGIYSKKIILCGVCRNTENAFENTKKSMIKIGKNFKDYAIVIYENNSTDQTAQLYRDWAKVDTHVNFIAENLSIDSLPLSRTDVIAQARNKLLEMLRDQKYEDYEYVLMADLDFLSPWPEEEIMNTFLAPFDWDCISANGILDNNQYYDRYAFRDKKFPLGPEILGDYFWIHLRDNQFQYTESFDRWFIEDINKNQYKIATKSYHPVYAAFGGLAIYKRASLISFSYSGIVTEDLKQYYKKIIKYLPSYNFHLSKYIEFNSLYHLDQKNLPVIFRQNTLFNNYELCHPETCCEHVPLQASMAINGFGKFFVNTKLKMKYKL